MFPVTQTKKPFQWKLLAVSLVIMILFSFLACLFNTGMFAVSVKRIRFDTEHGELSGLLYMPHGAGANDPRPTVIVTHGYLNSAEMQDANAIELSRRGYVVLALDMYDHGHSDLNDTVYEGFAAYGDFLKTWAPFWLYSMTDAVKYMYAQDYVLKDENGNGIIGVTGHSMGGFSSTMAVANDEQLAQQNGYRMIHACLTEGSDFSYSGIFGVTVDAFNAAGGDRYLGKVAARFDEFFFNDPLEQGEGTVREKFYIGTPEGMAFLQAGLEATGIAELTLEPGILSDPLTPPEDEVAELTVVVTDAGAEEAPVDEPTEETVAGLEEETEEEPAEEPVNGGWEITERHFAEDSWCGNRIIYQPRETHPMNHISTVTTGHVIEFYNHAFENYMTNSVADGDDQIWFMKEIFECVALVGFVLFILALAKTLIGLPFFSNAKTGELPLQPKATGAALWIGILILIAAILLPAILFETMYNWSNDSVGLWILFGAGIAAAVAGLAYIILNKTADGKRKLFGGLCAILSGGGLALLTRLAIYGDTAFFVAPVVNDIAKWTVGSMFIALVIMSLVYLFLKIKNATFADYGITFKPRAILGGLCTAVVTVAGAYLVLFVIDLIFKTDFRIWTFAFKTFDGNILPAVAKYLPTFLAYYFVSSAAICINTNTERLKGWKGYLVAVALNCGGIIIWLLRQYITLFATGTAAHPNAALSGIVLVAMVPTLAIAAVISRYLYKRTGNIWTPAFLNGILMTIMTVANTTVYFK